MALTDKLWDFWERLNRGEIDWDFVENTSSEAERNKAFEILLNRGFIVIPKPGEGGRYHYVESINQIVAPKFGEDLVYFTKEVYARGYAAYLRDEKGFISINLRVF